MHARRRSSARSTCIDEQALRQDLIGNSSQGRCVRSLPEFGVEPKWRCSQQRKRLREVACANLHVTTLVTSPPWRRTRQTSKFEVALASFLRVVHHISHVSEFVGQVVGERLDRAITAHIDLDSSFASERHTEKVRPRRQERNRPPRKHVGVVDAKAGKRGRTELGLPWPGRTDRHIARDGRGFRQPHFRGRPSSSRFAGGWRRLGTDERRRERNTCGQNHERCGDSTTPWVLQRGCRLMHNDFPSELSERSGSYEIFALIATLRDHLIRTHHPADPHAQLPTGSETGLSRFAAGFVGSAP
jgi:hypothetical protein